MNFTDRPVWHWWAQRLTAVGIIPFIIWALMGVCQTKGNAADLLLWLKNPLVTIIFIGLSALILYHAQLGIKVIVEDYVSGAYSQKILCLLNTSGMVSGMGIILLCFYKLHTLSFV